MANIYFKFKKFTIWQDKCAMKVGTDGVLLGAWVSIDGAKTILDVGAGTGLVSLMLAQRAPNAQITAVEIDGEAAIQATQNVDASPWADRIHVVHSDFKLWQPSHQFDLIVSNPPYFNESLTSPDIQRNLARHNQSLSYKELIGAAAKLLTNEGSLAVIIPSDVSTLLVEIAAEYQLFPHIILDVLTKPGANPKRNIIVFKKSVKQIDHPTITIDLSRHCYSDEFAALLRPFYLKL